MSDLYNRIELLCKAKGVNVTAMCKLSNIPRSNLSKLKQGNVKTLSVPTLTKLADYFGVTLEYLLGWDRPIDELDKAVLELDPTFVPGKGYVHIKQNTPAAESAGVSDDIIKLVQSIAELPEQEQVDVQNYIAFLKSKRTE